MENGAARNKAKMEKVAAPNRLIYGRLLLRRKYSGPYTQGNLQLQRLKIDAIFSLNCVQVLILT
jgi:hypothetical protein